MMIPAKGGGGSTTTRAGTELPIPTLGLISNHSSVTPTGIGVGVTGSPSMSQNNMVMYNSMTHAMTACPQQQPVTVASLPLQQQQFQQTQQLLQQQQATSQLSPFYVDPQLQLFQQAQQQIQMEHQQQQTPNQSQQQVQVQVQLHQQQQQEQFEQQESNQGSDESLQQIQLDADSDSQLNLDPANYFDSMLASLNCDLLDGPGDADLDPTGTSAIFNFSSLMDGDELPSISDSALSAAFDGVDDSGGLGNFGPLMNVPGQRRQPAKVSIRFKNQEIYNLMRASNKVTNSNSSSILNSSNSYNSYGDSGLNFGMGFHKSTPSSTVTSEYGGPSSNVHVNLAGHGSGGYSSSYNNTAGRNSTTLFSSNSTSNAYHQQSLSKFVDDFGITDVTPMNIKQSNSWALGSPTFSSPSSSNLNSQSLETPQPPPSSTVTQAEIDSIPTTRRTARRKSKKKKLLRDLDQDCDSDLEHFQHWEKEQMILEKEKSRQDKSSSDNLLKSGKVKPLPIAIMRKSSTITGARLGTFSNTFKRSISPPMTSFHHLYSGSSSSNSSSSSRKRKVISTVFSHSDPMASKKPKITFSPLISSANLSPDKRSSSTSTPTSYTSSVPLSPPFLPSRILPPIRPQTIFTLPSAGLGSLTAEICSQMPNLFQGRTPKRKLKPKGKGKDKHHRGHHGYHHSHHHHGYYRGPYGHGTGKGKGHAQKQVPHQHHRCALHSPSKIEAGSTEASPAAGVTTRSGSQKLAAEKLKQQKAPPPKPPPPPPQQKPRIPVENIFLRKYDPIRIFNRLRKAALPITTKNTERDKVMICNDFLEKKEKKKVKKLEKRNKTKRNGVRGHRVSNTNHGRKLRREERARRRKEREKQREVRRKQRLEKIKFRLKTQAKMKARRDRVEALLKENNNNNNSKNEATTTSTSTMPPPRYPPPWSQKVNGASSSSTASTSAFKVDKKAIHRKALEMLQKKRKEPPPTLQELARRRQRRGRELRKKLTVNGKLTVNEAHLLKRRRGLTVKYKRAGRGVSPLRLRVMTAFYLRRALERLRGHPKATRDLLKERRKKWRRRVKRREKVMEAFEKKERRRHTLKRLRKQQRKMKKLAKRGKLTNKEKAKLAGLIQASNIPKRGSKVKVSGATGKKVPVTKSKLKSKEQGQRPQSSKITLVNSYGKPVFPGMKRSKNQVEFPLTKIKVPPRPAQVTSAKFTIQEDPYLLHVVELLKHKRELQGHLETLETEGVVHQLPPPPEKPDPSTMRAPPLLGDTWRMTPKQAKHVISQRLLINCAIVGYTNAGTGSLEMLADALGSFMKNAAERLKVVTEMEMMNVDQGFPDPMERVLNELGLGGIHGLNEFHRVKYKELGSRMADQCALLRRQYAYKVRSKVGQGLVNSSSSTSSSNIQSIQGGGHSNFGTATSTSTSMLGTAGGSVGGGGIGGGATSGGRTLPLASFNNANAFKSSTSTSTISSSPLSPGNSVLAEILSSQEELHLRHPPQHLHQHQQSQHQPSQFQPSQFQHQQSQHHAQQHPQSNGRSLQLTHPSTFHSGQRPPPVPHSPSTSQPEAHPAHLHHHPHAQSPHPQERQYPPPHQHPPQHQQSQNQQSQNLQSQYQQSQSQSQHLEELLEGGPPNVEILRSSSSSSGPSQFRPPTHVNKQSNFGKVVESTTVSTSPSKTAACVPGQLPMGLPRSNSNCQIPSLPIPHLAPSSPQVSQSQAPASQLGSSMTIKMQTQMQQFQQAKSHSTTQQSASAPHPPSQQQLQAQLALTHQNQHLRQAPAAAQKSCFQQLQSQPGTPGHGVRQQQQSYQSPPVSIKHLSSPQAAQRPPQQSQPHLTQLLQRPIITTTKHLQLQNPGVTVTATTATAAAAAVAAAVAATTTTIAIPVGALAAAVAGAQNPHQSPQHHHPQAPRATGPTQAQNRLVFHQGGQSKSAVTVTAPGAPVQHQQSPQPQPPQQSLSGLTGSPSRAPGAAAPTGSPATLQQGSSFNLTPQAPQHPGTRQVLTLPLMKNVSKNTAISTVMSRDEMSCLNAPRQHSALSRAIAAASSPGKSPQTVTTTSSSISTSTSHPLPPPKGGKTVKIMGNNVISINLGGSEVDATSGVSSGGGGGGGSGGGGFMIMHAAESSSPTSSSSLSSPNSVSPSMSKAKLKEAINQRNLLRLNFVEPSSNPGESTVLLSSNSTNSNAGSGAAVGTVVSQGHVQYQLGKVSSSGQTISWNSNFP